MLSQKMKELRELHSWSQKDLAEQISVGQSAIASYEGGRNEPNIEKLIALSKCFGVPIDYLVVDDPTSNDTSHELYRKLLQLSDRDKFIIGRTIDALLESEKKAKDSIPPGA